MQNNVMVMQNESKINLTLPKINLKWKTKTTTIQN